MPEQNFKLFTEVTIGEMKLKNRVVMAPMTRSRAIGNVPNDLMSLYYSQRAGAGLIITEGTAPSPNGLGYPRIPGVYSAAQVAGWQKVTQAVHEKNGKIFLQIMHTGRVSHPENMPPGARVLAPSAVGLSGEMFTDSKGLQPYPIPQEMSFEDIQKTQREYVQAAIHAMEAGFDGVELHGANGYLIDQFINPASNRRSDSYGGSMENRCRFALEVSQKVLEAIGAHRTGIRLSPYGVFNDMGAFEGLEDTYEYLAAELGKLNLVYLHTVDHSSMGAPEVTGSVQEKIRSAFGGNLIASGGLTKEKAEEILQKNKAELTAFARAFLANPDLVYKMKHDLPLNQPDMNTFYTSGEKGYTDYPVAPGAES